MNLLFPPREYERLEGTHQGRCEPVERSDSSEVPAQGFCLRINADSIELEASDSSGLFYGRQVLEEILEHHVEGQIPCCRIMDWPDFSSRGYMLDISRDRVPTLEHLIHLVNYLSKLRYNQLQLYTEHTFAYRQHERVWANASPLTAAEIRELDQYCRERQIELVPNQNSFGHMERWLVHDAYKHLAECPDGFRHPLSGEWRPQGSVIKPDEQSLDFLDGLYTELLPNFSSAKFNIGGDEPWELGEGLSAEQVKAVGRHKVYADFLAQVCDLATRHGAEPMCWADVLLEEPSSIELLPDSIRPVVWGYEVDHPFDEQCALLADLGRDFYVAPGDSTWNSYTGRLTGMVANVRCAARSGQRHGAAGLLMTHWGDGGHPQTWPISLSGMAWAGLVSWNVKSESTSLEATLRSLIGDKNGIYVRTLMAAGRVDDSLGVQIANRSFLAQVNQLDDALLSTLEPRPSEASIQKVIRDCEDGIEALPRSELSSPDASYLMDELELALQMNLYAATRCLGAAFEGAAVLRELYKKCWHYRSRSGGLEDSLSQIYEMNI